MTGGFSGNIICDNVESVKKTLGNNVKKQWKFEYTHVKPPIFPLPWKKQLKATGVQWFSRSTLSAYKNKWRFYIQCHTRLRSNAITRLGVKLLRILYACLQRQDTGRSCEGERCWETITVAEQILLPCFRWKIRYYNAMTIRASTTLLGEQVVVHFFCGIIVIE